MLGKALCSPSAFPVWICSDLLSISLKIKQPDSASQQLGPYITSHSALITKLVSECFSNNANVTAKLSPESLNGEKTDSWE